MVSIYNKMYIFRYHLMIGVIMISGKKKNIFVEFIFNFIHCVFVSCKRKKNCK